MEKYLENLYGVAEDVVRLDPWHRQIAPFVLRSEKDYVLVTFESQGQSQSIRFYDGDLGSRAYFLEHEDPSREPLEKLAEWTAGAYWEVVDQASRMSDWERQNAEGQDRSLAFRSKKAGLPPDSLSKKESSKILGYMRALRKILSRDADKALQKKLSGQSEIRLPSFDMETKSFDEPGEATLRLFSKKRDLAPVIDEFTAARLRFSPVEEDHYELYFFYLPITTEERGKRYFMLTAFLVNLSDGVIEWSDVLPQGPNFRKNLMTKLFNYWLEEGIAPAGVLCSMRYLYELLEADFRQAGIPFEKINQSYVGSELIETYMTSSKIKVSQYEALQVPGL